MARLKKHPDQKFRLISMFGYGSCLVTAESLLKMSNSRTIIHSLISSSVISLADQSKTKDQN